MPKTNNKAKAAFVAQTTANILKKAKINPLLVKHVVQQNANARAYYPNNNDQNKRQDTARLTAKVSKRLNRSKISPAILKRAARKEIDEKYRSFKFYSREDLQNALINYHADGVTKKSVVPISK